MKKKILLVEDSKFLRSTLERTLNYAGYQVNAVANGREGLEQLQGEQNDGQPFDLLVTDILMPIMSETELIQAISEAGISIPILVITDLRRDQRQQLHELFPHLQVLEKPFDPDQLIDAVTNLIQAE